jgi:hypothetical protein
MRPYRTTRHRALVLLAGSPDGHTEAIMLAHGFTAALLAELIDAGLVSAHRQLVGRGRPTMIMRLRITEAGRTSLKKAPP